MTAPLDRTVTAAIRAGYAWSVRHFQPQAWREVARMTGVIMRAAGPGNGPVTPTELVAQLRLPLGDWLPGAVADESLATLVVLDDSDQLSDATYEIGCDYTVELLAGQEDPGEDWLPSWRIYRTEQIERATFHTLRRGSDEDYTRGRRFLVENSAGDRNELQAKQTELGLLPLVAFVPIPDDRQHRGWWWACPLCRWPMRIRNGQVNCSFPRHNAAYALLSADGRLPRLQPLEGAPRRVWAQPAEGAVCVDESVWRYIVVPGVVEVRLCDRLGRVPGIEARLYPFKDRYDIQVLPDDGGWEFTLDVKDFASAHSLANKLIEKPVAAKTLVLPQYRSGQLTELRRLLPGMDVMTERGIYAKVRRLGGTR